MPLFGDFTVLGNRRGVLPRRLGQSCQQSGLAQTQVLGVLTEVALRGRLGAVGEIAEVNLVEIPLEDLVVVELSLQLQSDHSLFDFSVDCARRRSLRSAFDVDVLHQLLGDGAATCALQEAGPERRQVFDRRPRETAKVYARIVVEAVVLRGDSSGDQPGRYFRQRLRLL